MAKAIHVAIMAIINLELHSCNVNCDIIGTFLKGNINLVILSRGIVAHGGKDHNESNNKSGFTMIPMAYSLNVDMRFLLLKFAIVNTTSESASTRLKVKVMVELVVRKGGRKEK
ncbi:hypothetical protein SLE2022_376650 [Rubroshorea leprosula]